MASKKKLIKKTGEPKAAPGASAGPAIKGYDKRMGEASSIPGPMPVAFRGGKELTKSMREQYDEVKKQRDEEDKLYFRDVMPGEPVDSVQKMEHWGAQTGMTKPTKVAERPPDKDDLSVNR